MRKTLFFALPLLAIVACADHQPVAPLQEASFHHAPGHGGGGADGDAGNSYEIVTLGTLGGSSASAWAGNRSGVVVGEGWTAGGERRAFVWTEADGMEAMADLESAVDINEGGKITGLAPREGFSLWQGYVYDRATGVVEWLPGLPDHTSTNGMAVNDDGWAVGRSSRTLDSGAAEWQTVVWIPEADGSYGEPLNLQCPDMQVHMDINQRGDVVANGCTGSGSPPHLWIWNGTGYDAIVLVTLGGYTMAVALDDRGRVAGWSTTTGSDRRAVLWHPDDYGTPIDLGSTSFVADMSNENQVVGSRSTRSRDIAVVWTVDDAGNVIAFNELPSVSGHSRAIPRGITDEGWVVGMAHDGRSQGIAVVWRPLADGNGDDGDVDDDNCNPHPRTGVCRN